MSSAGLQIAATNDCLQLNGGKQCIQGGGYWFEIIEIDEKHETQRECKSLENDDSSLVNEENTKPSCVTNYLVSVWSDLPWKCATCSEVFSTARQLIIHNCDVHKIESYDMEWICADCPMKFRFYSKQINHVRQVHHENLSLCCDVCNKIYVSFVELDDHRREVHKHCSVPSIRLCVTCGQGYKSEDGLKLHLKTVHLQKVMERLRFDCTLCNKSYSTKTGLTDHNLVHGPPNFACKQCGRKFHRKRYLQQHIITHTSFAARSSHCSLCRKSNYYQCAVHVQCCKLCRQSYLSVLYAILKTHTEFQHL